MFKNKWIIDGIIFIISVFLSISILKSLYSFHLIGNMFVLEGLILLIIAVILSNISYPFSLALLFIGETIFVLGINEQFFGKFLVLQSHLFITYITVVILQIILYFIYRHFLSKLINIILSLISLKLIALDFKIEYSISIGILFFIFTLIYIFKEFFKEHFEVLFIGFSLFFLGVFYFDMSYQGYLILLLATSILLKDYFLNINILHKLIILLTLVFGFFVNGLIISVAILLLSFLEKNRFLITLSSFNIAILISIYYYNLEYSLLIKSFLMIGFGSLLLIIRYFLRRENEENIYSS